MSAHTGGGNGRGMKRCYVARYPLAHGGNDLNEEVLARDTWWSPGLRAQWETLTTMTQTMDRWNAFYAGQFVGALNCATHRGARRMAEKRFGRLSWEIRR